MDLMVKRILGTDDATLSYITIDDEFECFGLEDEYREVKVAGETRIPAGCYDVKVRTVGGFHNRYKRKFPDIHQGMLQLMNVPGFDFILIHIGNTDDDTAGCILVGAGANTVGNHPMITHSAIAYRALYSKVIDTALLGDLICHVEDE